MLQFEEALKRIEPDSINEQIFLYGTIGNLYRIAGDSKQAISMLEKCYKLAEESGIKKSRIANLIRLGEAFKYAGQYEDALKSFDIAIQELMPIDDCDLLDFAMQHKGKCLMEVGEWKSALSQFHKALCIRKRKGSKSLINSTELAIQFVKEKIDNNEKIVFGKCSD
ncbi:tetratricopeptide repeat protein [Viridibacillus sp. YIM B01967]|uniref:Tetratricopeptide repeat protein n=1 Tax=Viridibacillus soli TaxID=2798301 RepID=A0ABS1HAV1_9BACL|nr:tetratricopeptide repeat protein [Viridibacillus soli]MBK3496416.1 tetratricopeptide repeat protein [Viridibacillus soli]